MKTLNITDVNTDAPMTPYVYFFEPEAQDRFSSYIASARFSKRGLLRLKKIQMYENLGPDLAIEDVQFNAGLRTLEGHRSLTSIIYKKSALYP